MRRFPNNNVEGDPTNYQQILRNKSTVKKEIANKFIQLDLLKDKENEFDQSNLISNQVRTNLRNNQEGEQEDKTCANHNNKGAEFIVKIDGQVLNYCRKCATHIASQGFDVHKIGQPNTISNKNNKSLNIPGQSLLSNISPNRSRQAQPVESNYQQQKRLQLYEFIKCLKKLKMQYNQKSETLCQISDSFQEQKQTLSNYYCQLISYIQEIRDIHLQAIQQESVNTVQVCEIQKGQIQQTLEEIEEMVNDIQYNMQSIVNQIDQDSYVECFSFYRQKQGIFSHRLEELGTQAKPWPCTTQQEVKSKIKNFKSFVNQLHEVGDGAQSSQVESRYHY